jgi:hypothetical protein
VSTLPIPSSDSSFSEAVPPQLYSFCKAPWKYPLTSRGPISPRFPARQRRCIAPRRHPAGQLRSSVPELRRRAVHARANWGRSRPNVKMASLNMSSPTSTNQPTRVASRRSQTTPDHTWAAPRPHKPSSHSLPPLLSRQASVSLLSTHLARRPVQAHASELQVDSFQVPPQLHTAQHARPRRHTRQTRPLRCSDSESRPSLQAALFSAPQQSLSTTSIPGYLYRKVVPDACPLCEHKLVLSCPLPNERTGNPVVLSLTHCTRTPPYRSHLGSLPH